MPILKDMTDGYRVPQLAWCS